MCPFNLSGASSIYFLSIVFGYYITCSENCNSIVSYKNAFIFPKTSKETGFELNKLKTLNSLDILNNISPDNLFDKAILLNI